jgi:hypothetical protein
MDAHGRHIMINCVGEGDNPPVSVMAFAEYLARRVREMESPVMRVDILAFILDYEAGER